MMSNANRKLSRTNRRTVHRKEPPVLIVRPHKQEGFTCESTSQFLAKAFARGVADYVCYEARTPDIARNVGILAFLHRPLHARKTHLFLLDDDSTPVNDFVIERLMGLNKPVVAGVTPIIRKSEETFDCYWSPIIKNESGKLENIGIDEMPKKQFKAHRTGGTCLLLRRDALQKLEPPYQKFEFNEHQTKLLRSEDIYFSDKLREAGFDIWIDPESICHHFHTQDILDIFAVAIQAKKMGHEEAKKRRS
jgi:GT2 family glycosyltransferase